MTAFLIIMCVVLGIASLFLMGILSVFIWGVSKLLDIFNPSRR